MPVVYRPDAPAPPPPPPVPIFTLCDLAPAVMYKTENRLNEQDKALEYLRDALVEISSNGLYRDDFVELEVTGPLYELTIGQQEYSETLLIPSGDVNVATLDIRIWQDPPTNQQFIKLDPSHYQQIDQAYGGQSLPVKWFRFGGNIGFYPVPDKTYQVQARILRYHPIYYDDLCGTPILLPRDWNEILEWSAVERFFMALEEYEKAAQVHMLLFGDPEVPGKPGIIAGRIKKRQNEAFRQQHSLQPLVRQMTRYSR